MLTRIIGAALCCLIILERESIAGVLYSSDFESDDGGWVSGGFGDWEYGFYDATTYVGDETAPLRHTPERCSGGRCWQMTTAIPEQLAR